jgi:plastocyanin
MSQVVVKITQAAFSPDPVIIHPGDLIVWTNQSGNPQDATSTDGGVTFQTGPLPAGATSLPITFSNPSLGIPYASTRSAVLRGKVIVK